MNEFDNEGIHDSGIATSDSDPSLSAGELNFSKTPKTHAELPTRREMIGKPQEEGGISEGSYASGIALVKSYIKIHELGDTTFTDRQYDAILRKIEDKWLGNNKAESAKKMEEFLNNGTLFRNLVYNALAEEKKSRSEDATYKTPAEDLGAGDTIIGGGNTAGRAQYADNAGNAVGLGTKGADRSGGNGASVPESGGAGTAHAGSGTSEVTEKAAIKAEVDKAKRIKPPKYDRSKDYTPPASVATTLDFETKMQQRIAAALGWGGVDIRIQKMTAEEITDLTVERPVKPYEPKKPQWFEKVMNEHNMELMHEKMLNQIESSAAHDRDFIPTQAKKKLKQLFDNMTPERWNKLTEEMYERDKEIYAADMKEYPKEMKRFDKVYAKALEDNQKREQGGYQHYALLIDGKPARFFGEAFMHTLRAHGVPTGCNPYENESREGPDSRSLLEKAAWTLGYSNKLSNQGGITGFPSDGFMRARQNHINNHDATMPPTGGTQRLISSWRTHKNPDHFTVAELDNVKVKNMAVGFAVPASERGQEYFLNVLSQVAHTMQNQKPGRPDFLRQFYDLAVTTSDATVETRNSAVLRKDDHSRLRMTEYYQPRVTGIDPETGLLWLAVKAGSTRLTKPSRDKNGNPTNPVFKLISVGAMEHSPDDEHLVQIKPPKAGEPPRTTEEVIQCNRAIIARLVQTKAKKKAAIEENLAKEAKALDTKKDELRGKMGKTTEEAAALEAQLRAEGITVPEIVRDPEFEAAMKPAEEPERKPHRPVLAEDYAKTMQAQLETALAGSAVTVSLELPKSEDGAGSLTIKLDGHHARNYNKVLKECLRHYDIKAKDIKESKDYNVGGAIIEVPADANGRLEFLNNFAKACTTMQSAQGNNPQFLVKYFDKIVEVNGKLIEEAELRDKRNGREARTFEGSQISLVPEVEPTTLTLQLNLRSIPDISYSFGSKAGFEGVKPVKDGYLQVSRHDNYITIKPFVHNGVDAAVRVHDANRELLKGLDGVVKAKQYGIDNPPEVKPKGPTKAELLLAELKKKRQELASLEQELEETTKPKAGGHRSALKARDARRSNNTDGPNL
jgi:hypothetical protein